MAYTILLNKKIKKVIGNIEKKEKDRVELRMRMLSKNPISEGSKKIKDKYRDLFRVRVGDFRILYSIDHNSKEILIAKIDKGSGTH
ncbi:MAG: type II toxin-antitoxin system RelE/ParE family toxin [Methanomicrobia archaeon]|nr:type II toxin-antitoxin system RelE/ParE family toxin [Methanomicrobia archaeon]